MARSAQFTLMAAASLHASAQDDYALNVTVPGNVTAGVSTAVTLDSGQIPNDFKNNNSSALRVRLYTSVSDYPVCTLLDATPQNPTNFNVTLPIDVGPPGAYYALAVDYAETPFLNWFMTNQSVANPEINSIIKDQYSNPFFLSNATSAWISFETGGLYDGGLFFYESNSSIPCTSYECVRKCAQLYPTPKRNYQQPSTGTYDAAYLKCAGNCAGVRLPPNPETTGDPNAPPDSLLTPPLVNTTCDATQYQTPCNEKCCSASQVCRPWGTCVSADNATAVESFFPSLTPTPTGLVPTGISIGTNGPTSASSRPINTVLQTSTASRSSQWGVGARDEILQVVVLATSMFLGGIAFHL